MGHPETAEGLIDRFVQRVNQSPRYRIREEDVPLPLREGGARAGLYYSWTIQRFPLVNWIEPLEKKLRRRLPPTYRSLVTRYLFPAFEAGPLFLLANTGRMLYHEMSVTMARDKVFSPLLLRAGFAQFARPAGGGYDPICFDFNGRPAGGEAPVIRLDHEDLLYCSRPGRIERLAPSFRVFVEEYLGDKMPAL